MEPNASGFASPDQEVAAEMSKMTVTRKTSASSAGSQGNMFTIDESNKRAKSEKADQKGFSEKLEMKREMLRKQRSRSHRRLLSRNSQGRLDSTGRLDSQGRLDSMGSSVSQYDNNAGSVGEPCWVESVGFRLLGGFASSK